MCDDIANVRRKIQRISKKKILFMDEVSVKLNEQQNYTIVMPGEKSNVIATDTTSYSKRYDMIACCNGERVLPPIIFTPKDMGVDKNNRSLLIFLYAAKECNV